MVALDGGKKQIQLMCQFPDMDRFADPECHQWKDGQVSTRKDIDEIPKSFAVSFSLVLSRGDLSPFTRVTAH